MVALRRRLGWAGVIPIAIIVLSVLWLLRSSGERTLRQMLIGGGSRRREVKVTLRQGTYVGSEVEGTFPQLLEEFLGIPYGQSTAGERRFMPPLPVNPSTETFDASQYGDRCPSGDPDGCQMSEDCLNLNIYRPKERPKEKKLPVLVHIYGGSFNFGAGYTREVANMVGWSDEPFIGLTFNYRVGALGFLPSSLSAKEGVLNAGLKDQALLLAWVQENIAEFGGDPDAVTLMGSSAGAHSIGHHLMHNPSKQPLFRRLIIESGGPTARALYTPSNPMHEEQFIELLTRVGLEDIREEHVVDALRYIPWSEIKDASEAIFNDYIPSVRWPWQPVIDGPGGFIELPPINAWRAGKWHRVPILTGFNTNEGASTVPVAISTGEQFRDFFHTLLPSLSKKDLTKLEAVYPDPLTHPSSKYKETRTMVGPQFKRTEQAYGNFAYTCPVRHTGHFAASEVPVYLYHFAVRSSVKGGADHGTNNPYPTFNHEVRGISDTIDEVVASMHAYWTSFITTGDPNQIPGMVPHRPMWPIYEPAKGMGRLVAFGEGNDEIAGGESKGVAVKVVDDEYTAEECEYWWDRVPLFEI